MSDAKPYYRNDREKRVIAYRREKLENLLDRFVFSSAGYTCVCLNPQVEVEAQQFFRFDTLTEAHKFLWNNRSFQDHKELGDFLKMKIDGKHIWFPPRP